MTFQIEDWGLIPYEEAHRRQTERLADRLAERCPDGLLLLEHPPVITLGRGTDPANVLAQEALPVLETERGGDVTLHAPGQLVGYCIRILEDHDLHGHLRLLEDLIIRTLADFGLLGTRKEGKTGVWVQDRKIASIGVACRRWCTWHGFALNVSNDLSLFRHINPCGFDAAIMTSMRKEGAKGATVEQTKDRIRARAVQVFAGG